MGGRSAPLGPERPRVIREHSTMSKSVLVFLMEGFEEIETVCPIDILRRAEAEVMVASISDSLNVKGRSNIVLQADTLLASVPSDRVFDAVVVPGGPGTKLLRESPAVLSIVKRFVIPICSGRVKLFQDAPKY